MFSRRQHLRFRSLRRPNAQQAMRLKSMAPNVCGPAVSVQTRSFSRRSPNSRSQTRYTVSYCCTVELSVTKETGTIWLHCMQELRSKLEEERSARERIEKQLHNS